MKIFKDNVVITMELEEFLEVLEDDLFDELLMMITEMNEMFGEELSEEEGYDSQTTFEIEDMSAFKGVLKNMLGENGVAYQTGWVSEDKPKPKKKPKNTKVNVEDAKVRRILDRYKNVVA